MLTVIRNCFGGANAPICHGAGHLNKTPNDAVRAVEYVDANGKHQRVEDSEKVKAAAGAFGLLGGEFLKPTSIIGNILITFYRGCDASDIRAGQNDLCKSAPCQTTYPAGYSATG